MADETALDVARAVALVVKDNRTNTVLKGVRLDGLYEDHAAFVILTRAGWAYRVTVEREGWWKV